MKIIKVIYNDECKYIVDIIENINCKILKDFYNIDDYKQRKKALPIMTRHGTNNVPLIVFADENLDEYAAIWSEENPNWEEKIYKIINR